MARDPVCGQDIDAIRARAVAMHGKRFVYFCSAAHRDEFLRAPSRFTDGIPVDSAVPRATSRGKSAPIPSSLPVREPSRRVIAPPVAPPAPPSPSPSDTVVFDGDAPIAIVRGARARAGGVRAAIVGTLAIAVAAIAWLIFHHR